MEKRYSQMTDKELLDELSTLTDKSRKAEQLGMINEFAVLERKKAMAKSYLLNPDNYKPGEIYDLEGDPGTKFTIAYINGVFAWGRRNDSQELEAFPISMLK